LEEVTAIAIADAARKVLHQSTVSPIAGVALLNDGE
jgi:hypothetical protein